MRNLCKLAVSVIMPVLLSFSSCSHVIKQDGLLQKLDDVVSQVDGRVGIAVITSDGDTLVVNNDGRYTLMSVFKLHEALAVAHVFDYSHQSLDSVVCLRRNTLDATTWSPMLTDHVDDVFSLTVTELLRYILQQSDNNASNFLFDNVVSVDETDDFIRSVAGVDNFKLSLTEREMRADPSRSVENWSSPLDCAILINRVFTDSLVSNEKQRVIQRILMDCRTGLDRIYDAIKDRPDIRLAHKTGSGFRDKNGRLMAHNDVGFAILPDGRTVTIAVLICDFNGSEAEASNVISSVARIVFDQLAV